MKAVSTEKLDIDMDTRFVCTSFAASGRRKHSDSQFLAQNLLATGELSPPLPRM